MHEKLTLVRPHTHRKEKHPPGKVFDLDKDGLSKEDAEWLVKSGVGVWIDEMDTTTGRQDQSEQALDMLDSATRALEAALDEPEAPAETAKPKKPKTESKIPIEIKTP